MMEAAWEKWEMMEGGKCEPGVNIQNRIPKQDISLAKCLLVLRDPPLFSSATNQ